ncbi:hypothetical protein CERSUDRAFT_100859 [Gelatoporia subvermispora B]|uniref:Uncharacterized protein n=1 Tax=Ceriporiopsis subvermispora (strain B) TaxID=914234 RepID=M2QYG1_CERS8|nr:hypothetical protein CERSUDRAFT_100859 [Gelatoporia subvermispora B]
MFTPAIDLEEAGRAHLDERLDLFAHEDIASRAQQLEGLRLIIPLESPLRPENAGDSLVEDPSETAGLPDEPKGVLELLMVTKRKTTVKILGANIAIPGVLAMHQREAPQRLVDEAGANRDKDAAAVLEEHGVGLLGG